MFRLFLLTVVVVSAGIAQPTFADEAGARRARVALALADPYPPCTDLESCRAESLRTGKPLVLFVGRGAGVNIVRDGTAIYCRVDSYRVEGKPASGIVVLGPMKGGESKLLYVWNQLPGDAEAVVVVDAVKAAKSKAPDPVNWYF